MSRVSITVWRVKKQAPTAMAPTTSRPRRKVSLRMQRRKRPEKVTVPRGRVGNAGIPQQQRKHRREKTVHRIMIVKTRAKPLPHNFSIMMETM